MIGNQNEYDTGVNTFSPEGRIYQLEYAMNASKLGSTGIGIVCKEGVVLAVEKKLPNKLVKEIGFEKVAPIDTHLCCVVSGLVADAQQLIDAARAEAHYHRFLYKEEIPVKSVAQAVSDMTLNFGEGDSTSKKKPIARPYGVSLLFGGADALGPCLYQMDPSGTIVGYLAKGVGSAEEGVNSLLEKHYKEDLTLVDAKRLALSILKQVMEEKISKELVDVYIVDKSQGGYKQDSEGQIEETLNTLIDLY